MVSCTCSWSVCSRTSSPASPSWTTTPRSRLGEHRMEKLFTYFMVTVFGHGIRLWLNPFGKTLLGKEAINKLFKLNQLRSPWPPDRSPPAFTGCTSKGTNRFFRTYLLLTLSTSIQIIKFEANHSRKYIKILFGDICELSWAYCSLAHLSLSPHNVMFASKRSWIVRIVDFSDARLVEEKVRKLPHLHFARPLAPLTVFHANRRAFFLSSKQIKIQNTVKRIGYSYLLTVIFHI